MTSSKQPSTMLKIVSTSLYCLILAGALLAILIVVFFPYTLTRQSLWLGPSTLAYVPNPYLKVIWMTSSILSIAWFLLTKDKAFWKIALLVVALVICLSSSYFLNAPPAYLG